MQDSFFTTPARRHIALLLAELTPHSLNLKRKFRTLLRSEGLNAEQIRAFLAITPVTSLKVGALLEQTRYYGRRLAKLNVPLEQTTALLRRCEAIVEAVLGSRCGPAREQLGLAILHLVNAAYYEVREAEAQAFFAMHQAEREATDLDDLLRRFAGVLTKTLRARAGSIAVGVEGPRRPLYIVGGSRDEALLADQAWRGRFSSYWSFPLPSTGVIQLAFAVPYPWLPRELAMLQAAAGRCQAAIERSRQAAALRRQQAAARTAEEEERRRIGRELHDEAGQSLMVLRLRLEMLEREAPAPLRQRLSDLREMTENAIAELRRIIAALSPAVLERLGLDAAVRHLGERFRKDHPAQLRMRIALNGAELPVRVQQVIYRIAQESLQNIRKHSQASHVNLSLRAADKTVRLSVGDDGAGFCAETACRKPMAFGLAGMRERAELLGGTLTIRSGSHQGARVILELPNGQDSRTAD